MVEADIPADVGGLARRALAAAGYANLEDLRGVAADDLLRLHGFGPTALRVVAAALAAHGWSLRSDEVEKRVRRHGQPAGR